jgi:nicotinate-nucleotide adenylyltransferase
VNAVGIYGGNFNPVHHGHLITALKIFELRNLDKIIFIPAYISPFKTDQAVISAEHRLNMLKLAISGIPFFEYSDIEIKADEVSFTINTLRKLKDQYGRIELIIGYDNLLEFEKWKDPDEIVRLANLVVLKRINSEQEDNKNRFFEFADFPETPIIQISSTDIRERIRNNLPIDFLVPEKVIKYIYTNNLYKD